MSKNSSKKQNVLQSFVQKQKQELEDQIEKQGLRAQASALFTNTELPKSFFFDEGKGQELINALGELQTSYKQSGFFSNLVSKEELSIFFDKEKTKGQALDYYFKNINAAAAAALLSKLEHDAQHSLSVLLDRQAERASKKLVYDAFDVWAQPKSSFVKVGENYEADILLGAYSTQASFTVAVDGQNLQIQAGSGPVFPPNIQALLKKASAGDTYTFMNMKLRCPGDAAARSVPAPSFMVR